MSFSSSTCTLSVQRIIQWLIAANESSASRHIDTSIWTTHIRTRNGVQSEAARPGEILITTRVRRTPGSASFKQPTTFLLCRSGSFVVYQQATPSFEASCRHLVRSRSRRRWSVGPDCLTSGAVSIMYIMGSSFSTIPFSPNHPINSPHQLISTIHLINSSHRPINSSHQLIPSTHHPIRHHHNSSPIPTSFESYIAQDAFICQYHRLHRPHIGYNS